MLACLWIMACAGQLTQGYEQEQGDAARPPSSDGGDSSSSRKDESSSSEDERSDAGAALSPDAAPQNASDLDVSLASNDLFPEFLADGQGRAVYMYAGDVPFSATTACTGACAVRWPPFDANVRDLPKGLEQADFSRFHRVDGAFQVAYKGRPLYFFADEDGDSVAGDGVDGRWFVARDYAVFLGFRSDVSPWGRSAADPGTPFLTDAAGRALYAKLGGTSPVIASAVPPCVDDCLEKWPEWKPEGDLGKLPLPTALSRTSFAALFRDDGLPQVSFQGFPPHCSAADDEPGETRGHNVEAFRLVAPSAF
jgi:predicted lipoprotein with Yx(FWY)xxD motif